MAETQLEIDASEPLEIPVDLCCNCGRSDRLLTLPSELVVTRFFGLAGSEITFRWRLPFCHDCRETAGRIPPGALHVGLVVAGWTVGLFLAGTIAQMLLDRALLGGHDLLVAFGAASLGAFGFYARRRPRAPQTSWYQPVRIRKLRQKFSTGAVTGMILAFSNASYLRRFRDRNPAAVSS